MTSQTLSLAQARLIALHAQGFTNQDRSTKASWNKIAKTVDQLQLLQIDSVNVLVRSHYLPLFARLGNYDKPTLDQRTFTHAKRHFFECWAHEASFVPLPLHPLMRWRMQRALRGDGTYGSMSRFAREEKTFLKRTLAHIETNGPIRSSEVPGGGKAEGGWWGWSRGKMALETLFDQGLLTASTRQSFERHYDVPERVIPAEILGLPTPREDDNFLALIERAGAALGIATELDLRDYFRLPLAEGRKAVAAAVENGSLLPVTVESWKPQAYLHKSAKIPRKAGGTALVSPFDPLVWNRDRAERLFNFHYRIELYTPAPKRKFGYYVLPFLHGDNIAGRLCLKADRANNTLLVNRAHVEEITDKTETAEAMANELTLMTKWLGLNTYKVAKSGNLGAELIKAARDIS